MQAGISIMMQRPTGSFHFWPRSARRSGPVWCLPTWVSAQTCSWCQEFICLNTNFNTCLNLNYSVPFMQAGISIMMKRHNVRANGLFSFLAPLSSEIWTSLMFAYLGVSIVLFLVSRFSPCEWRIEETVMGTKVKNPFGMANSLFFALGTFMHQYTALAPRSVAGRLVGGAWWFFSLIIIAAYTSNMAAILTVERMVRVHTYQKFKNIHRAIYTSNFCS